MNIDLSELVKILPDVIMLILPGSIFLCLFCFLARRPIKKISINIEVIVISYVLKLIAFFLFGELDGDVNEALCILLFSACTGGIIGWIIGLPCVENVVGEFLGVRIEDSVWAGIADMQKGCYVNVFLEKEKIVYHGSFRRYYPSEGETWIELQGYIVQKVGSDGQIEPSAIYSHKNEDHQMVVINTKNIERIEIVYNKESNRL